MSEPDVVAELDELLAKWHAHKEQYGVFPADAAYQLRTAQAVERLVAAANDLKGMDAIAHVRAEARAEALEEAALIVDRHPDASRHRDSELMRGCCEVMAADIRALKDKGDG